MDSVNLDGGFSIKVEEAPAPSVPPSEMAPIERKKKEKQKKWKRRKSSYLPIIGCLRIEEDEEGNFDAAVDIAGELPNPTHLVVMVNGIMGSDQNWEFATKQFLKQYPRDVIIHGSRANSATLTFHGVDVMGERLAQEVISVIECHPSVKKISFIGHSVGGLVARYAIAKLHEQDPAKELSEANSDCKSNGYEDAGLQEKLKSRIAGLEPINFITFATPHLGSRWHKQVPFFCGLYSLEKVAACFSWIFGRTGKHLFLTDGGNGKPPLLLQMVRDSEDLKFMTALQSFKRHVAYANACYDDMVGWSTSSLRHPKELPKISHLSRYEKYQHVVHMDTSKASISQKELAVGVEVNGCKSVETEGLLPDEMLQALTKLNWERVDVKFNGWKQKIFAHNTIVVARSNCLFSDGADVIQHMIDNFLL